MSSFVSMAQESGSSAEIRSFFNHDPSQSYHDPYRGFTRGGQDFEALMVDFISQAEESLLIAVQEFRLPNLARELLRKKENGVEVKVVLENQYNFSIRDIDFDNLEDEPESIQGRHEEYFAFVDLDANGELSEEEFLQRDALHILRNGGVEIVDDTEDGSAGSGLMHHKFIVSDRNRVLVTSANFTPSDTHGDILRSSTRGNANATLILEGEEIASVFCQEFSILWGDGPGGLSDSLFGTQKPYRGPQTVFTGDSWVTVQFSAGGRSVPWEQTSNGLISQTLARAEHSIDAALFVFSEQWIANRLKTQHEDLGVQVRLVNEPVFAFRSYSETLDLWGLRMLDDQCRYEFGNNPWTHSLGRNVGVAALNSGDFLHHKFAVVDHEKLIFGSHNWSNSSNYQNDETLLVVESPEIAETFSDEFERHFSRSQKGVPRWLHDKISRRERECGFW